jgi:hypothetical protein
MRLSIGWEKAIRAAPAAVSLVVVAGVLAFPQTRWVATWFATQALASQSSGMPRTDERLPSALSGDLQAEIAFAAIGPKQTIGRSDPADAGASASRLAALLRANPSSAPVAAAFLRYALTGWTVEPCNASREFLYNPLKQTTFDSPAHQAFIMKVAAKFEGLDPANSYFSVLRGIGFCLSGSNSDVLSELNRAASRPGYTDYLSDEVNGRWKVRDAFGNRLTVDKEADLATGDSRCDAKVAYLGMYLANDAAALEQAGDIAGGIEIRRKIILVGSKMRHGATTMPSSIRAMEWTSLAGQLPSRQVWQASHPKLNVEFGSDEQSRYFAAYAARHGRADIADLSTREWEATKVAKSVFGRMPKIELPLLIRFAKLQVAILILACAVFWMLILIMLHVVSAGEKGDLPRNRFLRVISSTFAVAVGIVFACVLNHRYVETPSGSSYLFLIVPLILVGLVRGARQGRFSAIAHDLRTCLLAFAAYSAFALALLQAQQFWIPVTVDLNAGKGFDALANLFSSPTLGFDLVMSFVVLSPAIVLLAVAAIIAIAMRRPFRASINASVRTAAPLVLCVLVIAFSACTVAIARAEISASRNLNARLHGDGQYYAAKLHVPWPE